MTASFQLSATVLASRVSPYDRGLGLWLAGPGVGLFEPPRNGGRIVLLFHRRYGTARNVFKRALGYGALSRYVTDSIEHSDYESHLTRHRYLGHSKSAMPAITNSSG